MAIACNPVGWVTSSRIEPLDDNWESVTASIRLAPDQFSEDALAGLSGFSHIEVVYVFDRVDPVDVPTGARHPRDNRDWPKVGIFAQRGKARPNRLGVTACRLLAVDGLELSVQALDAIDGTPVLDIKPYMTEFGPRGPVHQAQWAHELMAGYWAAGPER